MSEVNTLGMRQGVTLMIRGFFRHFDSWKLRFPHENSTFGCEKCSRRLTCVLKYVHEQSQEVQPVSLTSFPLIQALSGKLLIKLINFPFKSKNKVVGDMKFFWVHCGYTCLWQSALPEATISAKAFPVPSGRFQLKFDLWPPQTFLWAID